jgi:hypothetical protein
MNEVVETVVAPTRFMILSNLGIVRATQIMDRQTKVRIKLFPITPVERKE